MSGRNVNGAGTINWDATKKRYRGRIAINNKRYYAYGKTRTETQTKLNAIVKAGGKPAKSVEPVEAARVSAARTVADLVTEWQTKELAAKDVSASTVANHGYAAKHITKILGAVPVDQLTTRDVETMLQMLTDAGKSRATLVKVRQTLSMSLRFAIRRDELDRDVTEHAVIPEAAPKAAERRALDPAQARALLARLVDERNGLLFAMSLRLGLRPGEAAALYWEDISTDADGNVLVNITRGTQTTAGRTRIVDDLKTKASKRTIQAPPDVAGWLSEHRKTQNVERVAANRWDDPRLVFASPTGNVLSPPNVRRHLEQLCKTAEVPAVRPNELRHSCASLLSDMGVPNEEIADLLGHTTTRMVDQTYRHRLRPVVAVAASADWAAKDA